MIHPKDLTIIIPHFGANEDMERAFNECYASLRETAPEVRIIVAKNGPACTHLRDIRLVSQGQNKAVNAAVAITDTPWILISNDDMIYPPHWFEKIQDMDLETSCVSARLVEPRTGAPTFIQYFCGGAGGDFDKQKFYDFVATREKEEQLEALRTGFNLPLLIKRELWNTIEGYDIQYDPWGSNGDSDLEYKIKLAGVQPYQNPNWLVYHFSQTSGTFEPKNQEYWQKNWDYFKEKWGFYRTDEGIWTANFIIPDKQRIYRPEWEHTYMRKEVNRMDDQTQEQSQEQSTENPVEGTEGQTEGQEQSETDSGESSSEENNAQA